MQLRIPGPTPCPDEVLKAGGRQMINHRGKEFAEMQNRITPKLQQCFQTKNDLLILTTSGTGGLESAVVNTLSPGDKVLGISIGIFGDRFAECAKVYGAEVIPLKYEWGQAVNPDDVKKALNENPGIKTVLVTHNETSTGTTNPLKEIDVAMVHDCFTITELIIMEDLKFAPRGGAPEMIHAGAFDREGEMAVNIDGGLKCFGHPIGASGLRMIYEVYKQLQGKADKRQRKDPAFGLTHNLGGFPGSFTCAVTILGKRG